MQAKKSPAVKENIPKALRALIGALLTIAQANALYYFVGYDETKNWVLVAAVLLPLGMMNCFFLKEWQKRKRGANVYGMLELS